MADFENVVVDITAKELEERVKKPIDMEARAGSLNLIYSGAVHSAVENAKVRTDNLVNDSVTTEKILEGAVTPNELDRLYVEYLGIPSVKSYAELDGYITSADDLENYKTLYRFGFDSSFPKYGLLGDSVYLGYIADYFENETPKLILINSETFEKWSYVRNSAEVIKIEPNDVLSQDFIYAGVFNRVSEMMNYNFEKGKTYRLDFIRGSGEELETNHYFAEFAFEITFDKDVLLLAPIKPNGKTFFVNLSTGACVVSYTADQTYNPESVRAQSGVAVAEALSRIDTRADYVYLKEPFKSKDDFVSYSFEAGKTYRFTLYNTNGLESFIPGEYLGYAGLGTLNFRYLYQVGKRYVLIGENKNRDIRTYYDVDQTYKPESENAQGGKAVAEAINSSVGDIQKTLALMVGGI